MKRAWLVVIAAVAALVVGCGSQQAAAPAPVTSTVTSVETVSTTTVSTRPAATVRVTVTAKATDLGGLPPDTITCASLTGIWNTLSKAYLEGFSDGSATYTDDQFQAFSVAVDMTSQTLSITLQRMEDPKLKALWEKVVADGAPAAEDTKSGTGQQMFTSLTTFVTSATAAMKACTAAMGR